jgi:two-component system, sensor histidine kinase
VRSDFIVLERIVLNLVSNAVRYTAHGGVLIGCRRRGQSIAYRRMGYLTGIPQDQQRYVFGEFYRLGNPQLDRRAGLGLGLSIVDGLGRVLRHPLELASRPGKGSRFSLSVPLVADPRRIAAAAEPPAIDPDPIRGRLIVVIDDDDFVLQGMRGLLK